ncbi:MAG: helix-turn-helix domain-containing protein [Erysipelotrichales bacterium]|nr:helix-turn-helix domain-containing protein [Erysipelotrichales bacterium]
MQNIKKARKEKGLSLIDLENISGVKSRTIFSYENEEREPTINNLTKIAIAMNMTVDELIDFRRIHDQIGEDMAERVRKLEKSRTANKKH